MNSTLLTGCTTLFEYVYNRDLIIPVFMCACTHELLFLGMIIQVESVLFVLGRRICPSYTCGHLKLSK